MILRLLIILLCFVGLTTAASADEWLGTDAEPADGNQATSTGFTYIYDEASPVTGTIDSIECYVGALNDGKIIFGVFTKSGSDFTDVQDTDTLVVSDNLNQLSSSGDFPAMTINTGEYFGMWQNNGTMERTSTGGPGYWFLSGLHINDRTADTYSESATTRDIQIRVYITVEVGEGDLSYVRRIKIGEGK